MRLRYRVCIVLLLSAFVTGCAKHYANDAVQEPYGFFSGVWHGLFFVLTLMANLISWIFSLVGISFLDSIEIVGRPNTGFWYYVGFTIGVLTAGGSASK